MKIPSLTAEHGVGPGLGVYLGRPPSGGGARDAVIPAAATNVRNVTIWPRDIHGQAADTSASLPVASGATGTYDDSTGVFAATLSNRNPGTPLALNAQYAAQFADGTVARCRLVTCTSIGDAATAPVDFSIQGKCSLYGSEMD
jgi:hypothetical protein